MIHPPTEVEGFLTDILYNSDLDILGVVGVMVDSRTNLHELHTE